MTNQRQRTRSYPAITCDADALRLDAQLCFPLYACGKEIVRRYKPMLDELGITYTQYIVLMVLWEHDGITVGDLGEQLYLDSGTLTPLLKKMETAGLVVRQRDEADERRVLIALTRAGQDLQTRAKAVPSQIARCVQLDSEEAMQLWTLLYKVLDGFSSTDNFSADVALDFESN